MSGNKGLKIIASLTFIVLFSVMMIRPAYALTPQQNKSWFWNSDTNIATVATGDVNGDVIPEIVTAGYYNDGAHWNTQLAVWDSATMNLIAIKGWLWGTDTQISSVAIGDVNGDGVVDIVTGGSYFDGTSWNAQLFVWKGSDLTFETYKGWLWGSNTQISSVAIGDVNGDGVVDIVTGGSYFDGTSWNAQLITWDGAALVSQNTLVAQNIKGWFWVSNTEISSVAIGDVNADGLVDIVTGGTYNDGTRANTQLMVWTGGGLVLENVKGWFWVSNTEISSVAIGDVNADGLVDIVTGGSYNDGAILNAQLMVWTGGGLVLENVKGWFWVSNTKISSVSVGNADADPAIEVIASGSYFDGTRYNAHITVFDGSSLLQKTSAAWFQISDTHVDSATISNLGTTTNHVISGGGYFDTIRTNAQITVWG